MPTIRLQKVIRDARQEFLTSKESIFCKAQEKIAEICKKSVERGDLQVEIDLLANSASFPRNIEDDLVRWIRSEGVKAEIKAYDNQRDPSRYLRINVAESFNQATKLQLNLTGFEAECIQYYSDFYGITEESVISQMLCDKEFDMAESLQEIVEHWIAMSAKEREKVRTFSHEFLSDLANVSEEDSRYEQPYLTFKKYF